MDALIAQKVQLNLWKPHPELPDREAEFHQIAYMYIHIYVSLFVQSHIVLTFLKLLDLSQDLRLYKCWVAFEDADIENDAHRMELREEGDLNGEDARLLRPGVDTQASNLTPRTSISPRTI